MNPEPLEFTPEGTLKPGAATPMREWTPAEALADALGDYPQDPALRLERATGILERLNPNYELRRIPTAQSPSDSPTYPLHPLADCAFCRNDIEQCHASLDCERRAWSNGFCYGHQEQAR